MMKRTEEEVDDDDDENTNFTVRFEHFSLTWSGFPTFGAFRPIFETMPHTVQCIPCLPGACGQAVLEDIMLHLEHEQQKATGRWARWVHYVPQVADIYMCDAFLGLIASFELLSIPGFQFKQSFYAIGFIYMVCRFHCWTCLGN
jgi:hypothetical protein